MRNKPHKWGFKLWGRAGSSGILLEFEVYQGATKQQNEAPQLSKTTETVLRMTSNVPDNQNYKVFADNLYTSLPLVQKLRERGIYYTGTVRSNRLKGSSLSSKAELKQQERGSSHYMYKVEVNSGIVAVRWYDNRTVDLLSSQVRVEPLSSVSRYDRKEKKSFQ
ncbi:PiggyBac transposable element-derived protein 4 [Elysia marginata]|uniref:PiggyBac transposable element-derived protein 4 n=1 Tax=Elysia marginata TaxID=1093978 RepID=A0AAV4EM28_9GAST|nr:PiggyBac transposable element-derived protein 4 [Elysia marginata]